jgi:hypothetical protein
MPETDANRDVLVRFQPQEWVDSPGQAHEWGRKQLIPAEDREPVSFAVPRAGATGPDGTVYPDESYEANRLQSHPAAPEWVTDWDGPYLVRTAVDDEETDEQS